MKIILNFMYTDVLEMTCQDIVDIYAAAQKLRMMKIIVKCIQVNCLSLMQVALRYNTNASDKKKVRCIRKRYARMVRCSDIIVQSVQNEKSCSEYTKKLYKSCPKNHTTHSFREK